MYLSTCGIVYWVEFLCTSTGFQDCTCLCGAYMVACTCTCGLEFLCSCVLVNLSTCVHVCMCTCALVYQCTWVHRLALVSKIALASAVLMWSHLADSTSLHCPPALDSTKSCTGCSRYLLDSTLKILYLGALDSTRLHWGKLDSTNSCTWVQ